MKNKKGQTMIEFVLIAIISLALIFGIMDIARLSWTMFHLHGAAFAAARAASVGKSFTDIQLAANWITNRTLGGSCLVTTNRAEIPSRNPPFTIFPLPQNDLRINYVNATVNYVYRPLFAYRAWAAGIPIRVSSRMQTEIPNPIPTSN